MNSRWMYALAIVLLIGLFVLTQFRIAPDSRPIGKPSEIRELSERDDLNILFIVIDTLRADRLGAWGYDRPTSPTLDILASRGIRFANHHSQSSWTKTSMASIWTGLYPIRSGMLRFNHALPDAALTPAEILTDAGYFAAGIWRNGWVAPTFGLHQGFALYHKPRPGSPRAFRRRPSDNPHAQITGSDMDNTNGAIEFLRVYGKDRWLLYLHYMDAHQYLSDEQSSIFGTSYSDLYDNSIHWTDRNIAILLNSLEESGLLDRTIVVISSDHGESFNEHGSEGHAKNLYSEVIHVPFIISLPFSLQSGLVVEAPTANIDIWPTLFDLVGFAPMPDRDGRSLVPEILAAAGLDSEPKPSARVIFAQLDRNWGKTDKPERPIISVFDAPMKYVRRSFGKAPEELFDLSTDPREQRNLAPDRLEQIGALGRRVDDYLSLPPPPWGAEVDSVELSDMQKGQLRALGYAIE